MKLKALEIELEDVDDFENPKIDLEQYSTTSHLAGMYFIVLCYNFYLFMTLLLSIVFLRLLIVDKKQSHCNFS